MTEDQVFQILDLIRPGWRTELDPMKFKTFAAYKEALSKAVDEGCKKLGLNVTYVH